MEKQNKKLALILLLGLVAALVLGFFLDRSSAPVKSSENYTILITEVCAKNETIIADNEGRFRDYIELYNAGDAVSLAGLILTDGQGESSPFGDVVLGSGEYRLVFLGDDVTGFGLGASGGDCIQLKDRAGGIVTQTNVSAMTADQVMTYQDGIYYTGYEASPGFPNDEAGLTAFRQGTVCEEPQIVISEILAENSTACPDELGRCVDVIELHNVSDQPLYLGSFWLSDSAEQRFKFRLPDVALAADGYLLIFCDGENYTDESGVIHANFGLSAGDTLCLTDSSGGYITAEVAFAGEDCSVALTEAGNFEAAAPSLGWPNTEEGIYSFAQSRIDEAAPLVISEVQLSGSGVPYEGELRDVVEIANRSEKNVSTAGWYLTDGGDAYEYPLPKVELAPGEYLVLVCSQATTGFALSEGETVSLTTPEYRISSPVTCVLENPGMGLSLLTEGYAFAAPSLGFANDEQGREDYAKATLPQGLMISELMTANLSYLLASYGVGSDWVELYNASAESISLADYCLSDDPEAPEMCALPDITLGAGEYCVILLTNKTDNLPKGYEWIPMTLSSEGEGLYLSHEGIITDYAVIPALVPDVSYGRPNGSGMYTTLAAVTPGETNGIGAETSPMPRALTAQGVYENVEYLDVELEGEGDIYYTLDCTAPGGDAILYTGPIRITQTTVIRAVCRQTGKLQSRTLDLTFLLNENDTLPAVSLVLEPDDLWSDEHGIYADGYYGSTEFPYKGSNFWQNWEKTASVTLMEKDGSGFSSPCGLKIFGGFSRGLEKKAFSCFFRDAYGVSELSYPLFGDEGLDIYEAFVLRASGQDFFTSRMRDVMMTSLLGEATRVPVQKYRPVVLYLNGEFWGVYYIREKVNENYVAGNYSVSADTVTIAEVDGFDCPEYMELFNYVTGKDILDPAVYARVCEMMDVEEYIDCYAAQMYIGNPDNDNARFFKFEGGKWTWIFYDTDMAFRDVNYPAVEEHLNPDGTGTRDSASTRLINTLLRNQEFKDQFLSRLAWQMNTIWTEENIVARVDELEALIEADMVKDCEQWGQDYEQWRIYVENLRSFAAGRRTVMIEDIQNYFHLTDEQLKSYGFIS